LEEWRRNHEQIVAEWRTDHAAMRKDIAQIAQMMSGLKLCPAPGDCLHIRQDIARLEAQTARLMDALDARIEQIENVRLRAVEYKLNFFRGSVIIIGSVASIIVGALTHWLFTFLRK
jgi:hypothetical protein